MTTAPVKLFELGQSLWYDNIRRKLLENGELNGMIERGEIYGVTSNPSIFDKAISDSDDYDEQLIALAKDGKTAEEILDRLILDDIQAACDLFLPLYERAGGGDGFVSIEVKPELAYDTDATIAEAQRLWDEVDRPNTMVKIPATEPGIPAIRRSIANGININITLIFSQSRYEEVMDAYLSGLEDRVKAGQPIDGISSVASFFVSRIDSKVDGWLEEIVRAEGPDAALAASLRGTTAVNNAKLAYQRFKKVFANDRFSKLKEKGARVQRPLWASTSTKNPAYSDVLYVEELMGADTVNTVPQETLDAFIDHGEAQLSIEDDIEAAKKQLDDLEMVGLSLAQATAELEEEGVEKFGQSFADLMQTVEQRRSDAVRS